MNKENFPTCTIINIPLCKKLGISYTEYVIADIFMYRANISDTGWCQSDIMGLVKFLHLTKAMINRYITRLIKKGLVERNSDNKRYYRTTLFWNRRSVETKYLATTEINK